MLTGSDWDPEVLRSNLERVMGHTPSHFMDSGAFSQMLQSLKFAKANQCGRLEFFKTKEFRKYLDSYAAFIKAHKPAIDVYANVDVILEQGLDLKAGIENDSARLSYRNLRYLEKVHGLNPIPVIHVGEPLSWLDRYIDEGYKFIALGGVLRKSDRRGGKVVPKLWVDDFWRKLCPGPSHLPLAKVHGFGIGASVTSMVRYPWWSADSTAWVKMPAYGQIVMPDYRNGTWSYLTGNRRLFVTPDSSYANRNHKGNIHFLGLPKRERRQVREWFELIDIPFGKQVTRYNKKKNKTEIVEILEYGITNNIFCRYSAIIRYTERFVQALPKWPWPFKKDIRQPLIDWSEA